MRRITTALVMAVLGCLLAGPSAAAAPTATPDAPSTGVGIRLLEAPADRAEDPRARSYVIDHVRPGQTIERDIEISNGTGRAAQIELYAGAARIDGGQFVLADRTERNELTSWTSVTPGQAGLSGGAKGEATLTIVVPPDAAPGEYYGVVWAAMPSDATPGGMAVTSRVGVRIYLSVGGAEPPTDFVLESLTAVRSAQGQPRLDVQVCNTGGRAVDLHGQVSLRNGPGRTSVGPVPSNHAKTLGVAQCGRVEIGLDEGLPDGPWDAEVLVRSGTTERQTSATVTFPPAGNSERAELRKEQGIPWGVIAAAAVIVLIGAIVAHRWARRPSRATALSPVTRPGAQAASSTPVTEPQVPTSSSSVRLVERPLHRSGTTRSADSPVPTVVTDTQTSGRADE